MRNVSAKGFGESLVLSSGLKIGVAGAQGGRDSMEVSNLI